MTRFPREIIRAVQVHEQPPRAHRVSADIGEPQSSFAGRVENKTAETKRPQVSGPSPKTCSQLLRQLV